MTTTNELENRKKTSIKTKHLGLYIHLPFCVKRCNYCDFLTFQDLGRDVIAEYIDALVRQIRSFGHENSIDTVFFGGGTPSFIDSAHIIRIMDEVNRAFGLSVGDRSSLEITLEANPESITEEKLRNYLEAGVNRLSIGVQSLNNKLLKTLGRAHSRETFLEKYEMARALGYKNISLDLIFALPGQSLKTWEESLVEAIELGPEHISFYGLQVEEGTSLKTLIDQGRLNRVDEEMDRKMYHMALELLTKAGYTHYEISNCSKPGYQSRHNLKYWSMEEYIGLGLGAHSYLGGSRYENTRELEVYLKAQRFEDFIASTHTNAPEDELAEYMFTGLRKVEGIRTEAFEQRFGLSLHEHYKKAIIKNVKAGLLQVDEKYIKLSLKGLDLFNQVLVDFL